MLYNILTWFEITRIALPGGFRARIWELSMTDSNDTPVNALKLSDLAQFTGSENWHRHGLNRNVLFTDGAKYVADTADAYWLLDEIAVSQLCKVVSAEEFQVWKLRVQADHSAELICEDGNDKVVFTKKIPFTDFPLDEFALYFRDNVIFLPNEN